MHDYSVIDLKNMLDNAYSMTTTPDRTKFPKYKVGEVIDRDKTVRWNEETVEAANNAFKDEASRLQSVRQAKINEVIELIYDYIIDNIGPDFSRKKAAKIWSKAYSDGHHAGVHEIFGYLDDYIDFANDMLAKD